MTPRAHVKKFFQRNALTMNALEHVHRYFFAGGLR